MEGRMITRKRRSKARGIAVGLVLGTLALTPGRVLAHCDGLDGPVVIAAQQALENNDVVGVLVWVQREDEAEIRKVFEQTLAVRKLSRQARELADMYFFETLVRVHRAGEGAPYTGLKPAGRDYGPAIPAADRALATGDPGPLSVLLGDAMRAGLSKRFHRLLEAKRHAGDSVEAGRHYVSAYVQFVHYVEDLHRVATSAAPGHVEETPKAPDHAH
jgi:hypothetical protein